jgi:hypothetical protein
MWQTENQLQVLVNPEPASLLELHLFTDKERVKFKWNVHTLHFPATKRCSSTHSERQNKTQLKRSTSSSRRFISAETALI